MNLRRVVIENTFGSLKNRWRSLKHFTSRIDRTSSIIVTCCVFHNYCEMWSAPELGLANARIKDHNLMGFGVDKLLIVRERKHAKVEGER